MKNILLLSSYPPRQCSIASFTEELLNALRPFCGNIGVIAVNDGSYLFGGDVVYQIREQNFESYKRAASWVNEQNVDLVHLQHEFSLFGGTWGNWILAFLKELRKPCVVTLHTVPLNPLDDFGQVLYEIGQQAEQVVVMSPILSEILQRFYSVEASKISIIRHGTPVVINRAQARHQLGIDEKHFVVSTFVLPGINKGIEYAIEAVAQVIEYHPNVYFYILGQIPPKLMTDDYDLYREQLETLVIKLKIEANVHFVNRLISREELSQWLVGSDVYITPYLDRYQSSSSSLTYAVAFGRAIVSTPYLYAQDLLAEGRGIIVEFDTLDQLSEQFATKILQLVTDVDLRQTLETKAAAFGKMLQWPKIGRQHAMLYQSVPNFE